MRKLSGILMSLFGIITAGAVTFGFVGCTSESPLESTGKLSLTGQVQVLHLESGPLTLGAGSSEPVTVSGLVTPRRGGVLEYRSGCYRAGENGNGDDHDDDNIVEYAQRKGIRVTLLARRRSVDAAKTLQFTLDPNYIDLEFGPHGSVFNRDLLLSIKAIGLDLSNVNPATLGIYYYNSQTGQWERTKHGKARVNIARGFVKVTNARIPHFSRYALAWSN